MSFPLYFDEDQRESLAVRLRKGGYDVLTSKEAGRAHQALSDPSQLAFATQSRRAIVTSNEGDYMLLFRQWWAEERHHSGIIIVQAEWPVKQAYEGLVRLLADYPDGIDDLILHAMRRGR